MGYTHYLTVDREHDLMIEEIGEDITRLIEASDVTIVNGWGEAGTEPEIDDEGISFNGSGDDAHETFLYPPQFEWRKERRLEPPGFNFVKTARKPYDEVVGAAQLVIKYRLGDAVDIDSDGPYYDDIWQTAIDLFQEVFPERDLGPLIGCEAVVGCRCTACVRKERAERQQSSQALAETFTASGVLRSAADETKCGTIVASTGKPCLLRSGHKGVGRHCRSVLQHGAKRQGFEQFVF